VEFKEDGVKLMLKGGTFDPERHSSKLVIKAATYHRLKVEKLEDGYLAEVIFDI
jgi:SHS2 domain-containing protein